MDGALTVGWQYGRAALHWAAESGNEQVVMTLLEHGAKPDIQDSVVRSCLTTLRELMLLLLAPDHAPDHAV